MEPLSWTECFRAMNELAGRTRLSWPEPNSGGFNCHPDFTISDVSGGAAWIVTAPGDWLLGIPEVAQFLELEKPVVGHWASWIIGPNTYLFVLWAVVALLAHWVESNDQ